VINVLKDELDVALELTKTVMENCVTLSIPLEVNIAYGNTLYEAK